MSTIRFTLIAIGLFALTFAGISWASKGFPVMAMRAEPMKPDARIATFEQSVKKSVRKDWENSKRRARRRRSEARGAPSRVVAGRQCLRDFALRCAR